MLTKIKNYSFALIELVFYFFAHYYSNTTLGTIFYLLFCIGMLLIVGYGHYRIKKVNQEIHFQDSPVFYIILICTFVYGIHGIISSLITLLN